MKINVWCVQLLCLVRNLGGAVSPYNKQSPQKMSEWPLSIKNAMKKTTYSDLVCLQLTRCLGLGQLLTRTESTIRSFVFLF